MQKNNDNVNYNNDIPNGKDNLVFELMKKIYLIIKQNQESKKDNVKLKIFCFIVRISPQEYNNK